jgi:hypothetical protein
MLILLYRLHIDYYYILSGINMDILQIECHLNQLFIIVSIVQYSRYHYNSNNLLVYLPEKEDNRDNV